MRHRCQPLTRGFNRLDPSLADRNRVGLLAPRKGIRLT